jgi:hypothetical protein
MIFHDLIKIASWLISKPRSNFKEDEKYIIYGITLSLSASRISNGFELVYYVRILHLSSSIINIKIDGETRDEIKFLESEFDFICEFPGYSVSDNPEFKRVDEQSELQGLFDYYSKDVSSLQRKIVEALKGDLATT